MQLVARAGLLPFEVKALAQPRDGPPAGDVISLAAPDQLLQPIREKTGDRGPARGGEDSGLPEKIRVQT
jgi:hypothetical protein